MKSHSTCSKMIQAYRYPTVYLIGALAVMAFVGNIQRASSAEQTVHIGDNFFSPKKLRIAPNDIVHWVNDGNSPHTTTSSTGLWNSGTLNHGDTFSHTFPDLGSFPYFCQVHGQNMSGTITVTTNAAVSNLFMVTLTGTFRSTNSAGKIVVTPAKTKGFVEDCAGDEQLDPADLALVYDADEDSIKVVQKDDGATVCTVLTFVGGTSISSEDGKRIERQAFVTFEDEDEMVGSIIGTERITRGTSGEISKLNFQGSVQLGLEMYEDDPPKVFKGTFETGRAFKPRL